MERAGVEEWGEKREVGFWLSSILAAPLLSLFLLCAGAFLGLLSAFFITGPLAASLWASESSDLNASIAAGAFLLSMALGAAALLLEACLRWKRRASSRVLLDLEGVRVPWGGSIKWTDLRRAFLVGGKVRGEWALHLWTSAGELVIQSSQVFRPGVLDFYDSSEAFLASVEEHLNRIRCPLVRGVPRNLVTAQGSEVLFFLFRPHRWWLRRSMEGIASATEPPSDHREALRSMRSAWKLEIPSFVVVLGLVMGVVTTSLEGVWPVLSFAMGGAVALLGALWSTLRAIQREPHTSQKRWTPDAFAGFHESPDPEKMRLVPANGCVIDARGVSRPDRQRFAFEDGIAEVEYGPHRVGGHLDGSLGALAEAWRMALRMRDERDFQEIFHNASADVVRHGDLDEGYALFNWICAREVARRANARLILSNGRVRRVGSLLRDRLEDEVVRYRPEELRRACWGLRFRVTEDRFEVWGPLVRFPEVCAVMPFWKALGAVVSLGLCLLGASAAVFPLVYCALSAWREWTVARHFSRPGFSMDREGVHVRGRCISWEELEISTLMPVAPGPILFAGPRHLLVAGHLGGTYAERSWLGCAAYQWIQENVCERVEV